ncbi:hypothetical protein SCOCK_40215 [Actinacidiphila cocklensis]|uniref:Uncharacterized protein n=1 Tax=Actinacidiphila cocklensis TaxID=887465 RepID=A0A9W4GTZ6_9ACTN|nr:hypothetical protein SCOCK_40215 [Actinacidiphila cocklensis]
MADGLAVDPAGPTPDHLTSSDLRASGAARESPAPGAHLEDESVNCERDNAQWCGRRRCPTRTHGR